MCKFRIDVLAIGYVLTRVDGKSFPVSFSTIPVTSATLETLEAARSCIQDSLRITEEKLEPSNS